MPVGKETNSDYTGFISDMNRKYMFFYTYTYFTYI